MAKAECCICKKGPAQGVSLFRANAKGVAPIWVCREHRGQTDAPRDPELDELVATLEGKQEPDHGR